MPLSQEHRELISKLKPVGVPETPCLDCEPDIDGLHVRHAALCPVAMCVDDITASDRAWFEEHPFADYYLRPVTWGEGADLIVQNPEVVELSKSHQLGVRGRVRVERMRDDVRLRQFEDVWFVVVPGPGAKAEVMRPPIYPA
jgi:hypothetical protein